jgi:catechol 2,3-dioxygenase-like lactoylglutathione lyase family enzyme
MTDSSNQTINDLKESAAEAIAMSFELVVIPVSDVDRAKRFYQSLGWHCDIDFTNRDDFRVIQFTPPGSGSSVMFGSDVTTAAPGSVRGLHLIVSDIEAARRSLLQRGIAVSEAFHDEGGVFHRADTRYLSPGPNPARKSYASYASFADPDGNTWVLQEVTLRLPPRNAAEETHFTKQLMAWVHNAQ